MDDSIAELSAEALIRSGGWNPKYARVVLIEHDAWDAVVLIDGNGDGAELELELEYWHRDDERNDHWRGGSTSGHGPLDMLPEQQSWIAGHFVAALGRAAPEQGIDVAYGGRIYRRQANNLGLWGFVHVADAEQQGELPVADLSASPGGR